MKFFTVAYLMAEDRKSIDDYKRHADKMNEAGRRARRRACSSPTTITPSSS